MKQKERKILLIMALVFFLLGFGSLSWSQQLQKQQQVIKPKIPTKLELPVDPFICGVCANNHYCSQALSGVNALLLQHITVIVGNHKCPNKKGYKATGDVTVSFFSYRHGRVLSKTVPFAVNYYKEQTIVVFSGLYLIKKSTGITATITKINSHLKDCDTSNNSKTVKKWMLCSSCAVVK